MFMAGNKLLGSTVGNGNRDHGGTSDLNGVRTAARRLWPAAFDLERWLHTFVKHAHDFDDRPVHPWREDTIITKASSASAAVFAIKCTCYTVSTDRQPR
jgi:hypothetical protein